MRYYKIVISDPDSGKVLRTFTSYQNGKTDPAALDVEMDLPVTMFHTPEAANSVHIWGVSREDIAQAADFNPSVKDKTKGKAISVFGGMQRGLPLATASSYPGLLVSGRITQALGNWIGTDMTLDLVFQAGPWTGVGTPNLTTNWLKGTSLANNIKTTLATAFPSVPATINISPNLKLSNNEAGFHGSLTQFASYLNMISHTIIPDANYSGVLVTIQNNKFIVTDGTTKTAPKEIKYTDLVGQVTWTDINVVQVTCIMRADIQFGDFIKLPPGQQTLAGEAVIYRNRMAFAGVWKVIGLRHVGRFRAPSGTAWITLLTAQSQESV